MNKIFTLITSFITFSVLFGQNLSDGSILFTSVQSDDYKTFSFVIMEDLQAKQLINFTDKPIDSLGNFTGSEGILIWQAPDSSLSKGTVVAIIDTSEVYATLGEIVYKSGSYNLSAIGDQIIAYEEYSYFIDDMGIIENEFLAAINFGTGNSWITSGEPSASKSYTPKGLTSIVSFTSHKDNGTFNCPANPQTTGQLRVSVLDIQNWTVDNEVIGSYCSSFLIDDVVGLSNDFDSKSIHIYPNPVISNKLFFEQELSAIEVYDLTGQLVLELLKGTEISIENLSSGVYLLKSTEGSQRFVIE